MEPASHADPAYLRKRQYASGGNLTARINLHACYSTNGYGWFRWVFDRVQPALGTRVLEVGCGTAMLWREHIARVPDPDCRVVLTDFSAGMLHEARAGLGALSGRCDWLVADAQALQFQDACFDVVIANHMLYHVPDRQRAIGELRRVLSPGGTLCASTIGREHLRKFSELLARHAPEAEVDGTADAFGLENGAEQLQRHFSHVALERYPDALEVPEPEPILAFLLSTSARPHLTEERLAGIRAELVEEIDRRGAFHVTKDTGLFTCR
jgi:ubiquinone/menaquinone biosynthesis C-methylase UbiE